jgi:hypothetical protein
MFQVLENVWLIRDKQLDEAGPSGRKPKCFLSIRFYDVVAGTAQDASDKSANEGILYDHNYAGASARGHRL